MKKVMLMICFMIGVAGCKKSGNTPAPTPVKKTYSDFLKNTEWTGTDDGRRAQYPQPSSMKFNADNSITIYSLFMLTTDGIYFTAADSIKGTISKIDSVADGSTHISVNFPDIGGDQIISIANRKDLVMAPNDPNNISPGSHTYKLALFPSTGVSVKGTTWSGPYVNAGPVNGYWYPDLSSIIFATNGVTSYTKNGLFIQQQTGTNIGVLEIVYLQQGARVFMYGYNDDYSWDLDHQSLTDYRQGRITPYFGVLLPSGDKMLVDARSRNARLPNYVATIDWYGPKGVTPVISKQ
ncbi:hypothetical protein [Mucilaginibacter sp.]|jgi:hypothetical protein|uniref:hypothetical protein n=1 Tax=Mucilaginibacter sp. TaxID=1882438 RepID=UPI00263138AA|nr:hypothetical protein [Mucilaginibacter sp.]MDB4918736.1 hypothetical protein [Mucilaginibacter sp.]